MNEDILRRTKECLEPLLPATYLDDNLLICPPFSYLHSVILYLLEADELFSMEQRKLQAFTSKAQKAGFLIRSLAFVTFALANEVQKYAPCILLVSPTKILAGLEVERTHEFLFQLGCLCRINNQEARKMAAERVKKEGEKNLYAFAVNFREGISKFQAYTRGFLCRKHTNQQLLKSIKTNQLQLEDTKDSSIKSQTSSSQKESLHNLHERENSIYKASHNNSTSGLESHIGKEIYKSFGKNNILYGIIANYQNGLFHIVYPAVKYEEEIDAKEVKYLLRNFVKLKTNFLKQSINAGPSRLALSRTDEIMVLPCLSPAKLPNVDETNMVVQSPIDGMQSPPDLPNVRVPGGEEQWKRRLKESSISPNVQKIYDNKPTHQLIRSHSEDAYMGVPKNEENKNHERTTRNNITESTVFTEKVENNKNKEEKNLSNKKTTKKPKAIASPFSSKQQTSNAKKKIFDEIIGCIDNYLQTHHMRMIDLFRYADRNKDGFITAEELSEVFSQLDIHINLKRVQEFITYVDIDGNGLIDINEFESLLRRGRRSSMYKDEIAANSVTNTGENKEPSIQFHLLYRYKQRFLDTFHILDAYDEGAISATHFKAGIDRLNIKGLTNADINYLITTSSPSPGILDWKALENFFVKDKKSANSYLNSHWLQQIDTQLDKIDKEYSIVL